MAFSEVRPHLAALFSRTHYARALTTHSLATLIHTLTHSNTHSLSTDSLATGTNHTSFSSLCLSAVVDHACQGNRAGHWAQDAEEGLLDLALDNPDPRVHFALVCGAQSCPALRVYSAANLERGLGMAAASFCGQEVELEEEGDKRLVRLSMIFKWYAKDFGAEEAAQLAAIAGFLPAPQQATLRLWLEESQNGTALEVEYRPYDWSLNKS